MAQFTLAKAARAAVDGISEAVRIMDLMGRGQDARNLDVHRNNLEAALRSEQSSLEALNAIRAMLAGYAGQPSLNGDIYKIADSAIADEAQVAASY